MMKYKKKLKNLMLNAILLNHCSVNVRLIRF